MTLSRIRITALLSLVAGCLVLLACNEGEGEFQTREPDGREQLGEVAAKLFGDDAGVISRRVGGTVFYMERIEPRQRNLGETFEVAVAIVWNPSETLGTSSLDPQDMSAFVNASGSLKFNPEESSEWLTISENSQQVSTFRLDPAPATNNGVISLTCETVGPGTYGVKFGGYSELGSIRSYYVSGDIGVTAADGVECVDPNAPEPPTETAEDIIEDDIFVTFITVGDNRYPISQFTFQPTADNNTYIVEITENQAVVSLDSPDETEWVASRDFIQHDGKTVEELGQETQLVSREVWNRFCDAIGDAHEDGRANNAIAESCDIEIDWGESSHDPYATPTLETSDRPTATPAARGVLLSVIKIGDAHYYVHQLNPLGSPASGEYTCGDNDYAVHLASPHTLARSFEYPDEPLSDPDPTGCGFGRTEEFITNDWVVNPSTSALEPEFPQVRFTARVIGEWCRRILADPGGVAIQVERLCDRNPPQD